VQVKLNKVIVASLSVDDLSVIQQMSSSSELEVIAVALDLGAGPGLRQLHDSAIAAGAARCHALDVREEFARECVLPAIDAETLTDGVDEVNARAREFVAKQLAAVAVLEGDTDVVPPTKACFVGPHSATRSASLDQSAQVDIAFEDGVPISVNGIPMSPVEVIDSLGTIGAAHGVNRAHAALRALQAAYHALCFAARVRNGCASLEIFKGRISVVQRAYVTI
jgi:argininosuccinate synthase